MWLVAVELVAALKREPGKVLRALDAQARSLLHWAISTNNIEIATLLIKTGISIDQIDRRGRAPLHYARSPEAIEALLLAGASANPRSITGRTPLHGFVRRGRMDLVRELLRRGGDVHMRDASGRNALHHAAMSGNADLVRSLVEEEGVDLESLDKHGRFPMYYALAGGHENAVFALIDLGADLARIDSRGTSWMEVSCLDHYLKFQDYQHQAQLRDLDRRFSCRSESFDLHTRLMAELGQETSSLKRSLYQVR